MEHSLLHGLQLCGLIFALGGAFFRLLVFAPVARALSPAEGRSLSDELDPILRRWAVRAALAGGLAAAIDIFVQVAEIQGKTVYGPVDFPMVWRYLTLTTVGRLATARMLLLLVMAAILGWSMPGQWQIGTLLGIAAAVAASLVSHAGALPTAGNTAVIIQFLHIIAAALWIGMLANVFFLTRTLRASANPDSSFFVAAIVGRFSPFALVTAGVIAASGIYSAWRFLLSPTAVFISPYGLTLLVKLSLLTLVLYPAFANWRVIRPALLELKASRSEPSALISRFSRLLELELTAGILVITVAGILGAISPPGADGSSRLTERQVHALLSPSLPPPKFIDPKQFVGALDRTEEDLRYSEFSHHWSGVFVGFLGLCWLGQSASTRTRPFSAKAWPLLLIPFGFFIMAIADPEVWILRTLSFSEALQDPQILEHQLGALLVFVLVFLGFRDARRSQDQRPLGYALPILMIAGSLMLLGHAHSNLGTSEELGTMINVQHAIFGAFGLMAGTLRWLQLRKLLPSWLTRVLWPSCVVGLGIFMAFFYREIY
ncbi:MAG TPA: CopD family protein [Verrucomicrobiae bacterium]|jgi:putative copper export protein|nr:CopD family protein [Verrucomicrobiae bacterium]